MAAPHPVQFPHIVRRPGVVGGDAIINGTEIAVWYLVVGARFDDDLLAVYPSLTAALIEEAFAYYAAYPAEIDKAVAQAHDEMIAKEQAMRTHQTPFAAQHGDNTEEIATAAPQLERFPHLVRRPGVVGGEPTVVGTRLAIRHIVQAMRFTESVEQLVTEWYPSLTPGLVAEALAFYEVHREEIDRDIAENDAATNAPINDDDCE